MRHGGRDRAHDTKTDESEDRVLAFVHGVYSFYQVTEGLKSLPLEIVHNCGIELDGECDYSVDHSLNVADNPT